MRSLKIKRILTLGFLIILLIGFNSNCDWLKNIFTPDVPDVDDNGDDNNCSSHPSMGKVGDTVSTCYIEIELKSLETPKKVCNGQFTAKGRFVIPEVRVKLLQNDLDGAPFYLCYDVFVIRDSAGNTYNTDSPSGDYQIRQCLPDALQSDICKSYYKNQGFSGKLIFDVPDNATGLVLRYYTDQGVKGDSTIEFDLGI